jgi:rubredoxin
MNKRYHCLLCGHIYDPREGDPGSSIPPGTAFEDLPAADFEPLED